MLNGPKPSLLTLHRRRESERRQGHRFSPISYSRLSSIQLGKAFTDTKTNTVVAVAV